MSEYTTASVYEGDDYGYAVAATGEAALYPADGSARVEGERSADRIVFSALPAGVYWLASRSGPTDAWTRPVRLVVRAFADPEEARLRRVVAALDERIAAGEGIVFQASDGGSDTSITTIGLAKLRSQRDVAASQLADYVRQRRGGRVTQWA